MDKEEVLKLVYENHEASNLSILGMTDIVVIREGQLLAFANACEKIGMEKLRPINWTKEMSDAWHQNIPDVSSAFDELIKKSI